MQYVCENEVKFNNINERDKQEESKSLDLSSLVMTHSDYAFTNVLDMNPQIRNITFPSGGQTFCNWRRTGEEIQSAKLKHLSSTHRFGV